ncbi:MAG TPA: tRNA (adenosine(37)-N6)-dimethylallyltransferase MiaA, partial [Salinimicrobium sp.]|nr:tRNA (adenosine(37)-N6)-dimethylallyltransferase MiaA [Salinimicrobium sp.]
SADSRQFYREMKIGTAAPTPEELASVPHHFVHHKSIEEKYTVGDFEREALSKLKEAFSTKDIVVMVGGSGLYINAVTDGLDDFPEVDPGIREDLNLELSTKGLLPMQEKLKRLDPVYYSEVDINNPHRIIRALEICIGTGKPYSSFKNQEPKSRPFRTIFIGLSAEREIIYDRINQRVDEMIRQGLLGEAQKLYPYKELNPLKTVGYQEIFNYMDGNFTLEEAIEDIKKNTRRFSKRQMTWFRKNEKINWFDQSTSTEKIIEFLEEKINS